jgi:Fe-S-cluster containining protein
MNHVSPETNRNKSLDDFDMQQSVFTQAYEQTCGALSESNYDTLQALQITNYDRNKTLDAIVPIYASKGCAECRRGCSACCHQMVSCDPFEVFLIANRLLKSKTPDELQSLGEKLQALSELPLDANVRYASRTPCALLESDCCTIYEQRPSACRTMLSASRKACDSALAAKQGNIPYVAEPLIIRTLMQLGFDYALITEQSLSTEKVEFSRALLMALKSFEATLISWINGADPFADCHIRIEGRPPNHVRAHMAAKRFKVAS